VIGGGMLKKVYEGRGRYAIAKPIFECRYPPRWMFKLWNLHKRIETLIGVNPSGIHHDNEQVLITFKRPIDKEQKLILDELMLEKDPSLPPKSPEILLIKDLETFSPELEGELWIGTSDGKHKDIVEIHYDRKLSDEDKKRILAKYATLAEFK
jgi:hypothetical protein